MAPNESLSQRRFALNNGSGEIPALGFGTSLSDRAQTRNAVKAAVKVGFRHLDAAERYRNEADVGAALKELFADGTVRRDELFVTTKLWNNNHRPERVKPALQASLSRLGLDRTEARAEFVLRLFDGAEGAGGHEGENGRAETRDVARRHQDRLPHHVRVYLIEHGILLRDAAAVDDSADRYAVLFHPLQNDARVERRALDGGK